MGSLPEKFGGCRRSDRRPVAIFDPASRGGGAEFDCRVTTENTSIRVGLQRPRDLKSYLERIQSEHRRIYDAIRAGDPSAARRAMRLHMMNSRRRYQRFANADNPS